MDDRDSDDDAYIIKSGGVSHQHDAAFFDNTYIKFEPKPDLVALKLNSLNENGVAVSADKSNDHVMIEEIRKSLAGLAEKIGDGENNTEQPLVSSVVCETGSVDEAGLLLGESLAAGESLVSMTPRVSEDAGRVDINDSGDTFPCIDHHDMDILSMAFHQSEITFDDVNDGDEEDVGIGNNDVERIMSETEDKVDCYFCYNEFGSEMARDAHVESIHVYTQREPHQCAICQKSSKTLPELRSHLSDTHEDLDKAFFYMCVPCVLVFQSMREYEVHRMEKVAILDHRIGIFREHWLTVYVDAMEGKQKTYGASKYQSYYKSGSMSNGVSARDLYDLKDSRNLSLSTITYSSSRSKNQSGGKSSGKLYNCRMCDKSVENLRSLSIHEQSHFVPTSYKCRSCKTFFHNHSDLYLHHRKRHASDSPRLSVSYKCQVCGQNFLSYNRLHLHQRSHPSGRRKTYSKSDNSSLKAEGLKPE